VVRQAAPALFRAVHFGQSVSGYRVTRQLRVSMEVLNLFNTQVSDIDYYYASQLKGEIAPVNDVHSHPAEPRAVQLTLKLTW
jgi:hypothetical protein